MSLIHLEGARCKNADMILEYVNSKNWWSLREVIIIDLCLKSNPNIGIYITFRSYMCFKWLKCNRICAKHIIQIKSYFQKFLYFNTHQHVLFIQILDQQNRGLVLLWQGVWGVQNWEKTNYVILERSLTSKRSKRIIWMGSLKITT